MFVIYCLSPFTQVPLPQLKYKPWEGRVFFFFAFIHWYNLEQYLTHSRY